MSGTFRRSAAGADCGFEAEAADDSVAPGTLTERATALDALANRL